MTRDPNTPIPPPPLSPQQQQRPMPPPTYQQPPIPVMGYASPSRPCPGCGGGPIAEPSFTWWGGLIGHKLLNVEQCKSCRKWWVKSTAQPGTTRVTIYMVVGIMLGLAFAAFILFSGSMR